MNPIPGFQILGFSDPVTMIVRIGEENRSVPVEDLRAFAQTILDATVFQLEDGREYHGWVAKMSVEKHEDTSWLLLWLDNQPTTKEAIDELWLTGCDQLWLRTTDGLTSSTLEWDYANGRTIMAVRSNEAIVPLDAIGIGDEITIGRSPHKHFANVKVVELAIKGPSQGPYKRINYIVPVDQLVHADANNGQTRGEKIMAKITPTPRIPSEHRMRGGVIYPDSSRCTIYGPRGGEVPDDL